MSFSFSTGCTRSGPPSRRGISESSSLPRTARSGDRLGEDLELRVALPKIDGHCGGGEKIRNEDRRPSQCLEDRFREDCREGRKAGVEDHEEQNEAKAQVGI